MSTKRYWVEKMGQRLFDTNSFVVYLHFVASLSEREKDELTFITSDCEDRCGDPNCDCTVDYGFSDFEEEELENVGILV